MNLPEAVRFNPPLPNDPPEQSPDDAGIDWTEAFELDPASEFRVEQIKAEIRVVSLDGTVKAVFDDSPRGRERAARKVEELNDNVQLVDKGPDDNE